MSEITTLETASDRTGTHTPGVFVWHEMTTKDVVKAQQFYTALLGWTMKKVAMPGMDYHLIHVGDTQIGGMFTPDQDVPSHWQSYVSVADVDKAAEAAKSAGGKVMSDCMDIPNVGRFAVVMDPQGAVVCLFKDAKGDSADHSHAEGNFCWDQLNTTDLDAAAAFYQTVVGWTKTSTGPEMGVFNYSDKAEASLMVVPQGVHPHWLTYIAVDNLAEATQKAEKLGAKVMMANESAGEWGNFSVIQDPVGAFIALFRGNER
jgi:predicted enzyme related to lactoylglutathione lyase